MFLYSLCRRTAVSKEFDVLVTGGTGYMGRRLISKLLARRHPATRDSAQRLGLVTLEQMITALRNKMDFSTPTSLHVESQGRPESKFVHSALVAAVEHPPS